MFHVLRSGDWVDSRIAVYPRIVMVILLLALASLYLHADGLNDSTGRPLGTDFSNVYSAGTYAREGTAERAYDWPAQHAREQQIFGEKTPFYGWCYPPFFLLIAHALAYLPYLAALLLWQAAGVMLYILALWRVLPQRTVIPVALSFTAIFMNLTHGHNGLLTAALFGGGLALLPTRPLLAGLLLGCLAYKPQFGVLIPFALLAAGNWRAILAATFAVLVLSAVTYSLYGAEVWQAFLESGRLTREIVLEYNYENYFKMQSLFAWVRHVGGGVGLAYAVQGMLALACIAAVWQVWRSRASYELKAVILLLGSLLTSPYSFDYDLMPLAMAMAFLVRHGLREGFAPYERSLLVAVWAMGFTLRTVAEHTSVFLGPTLMMLLLALTWQQARRESLEYGRSPA